MNVERSRESDGVRVGVRRATLVVALVIGSELQPLQDQESGTSLKGILVPPLTGADPNDFAGNVGSK